LPQQPNKTLQSKKAEMTSNVAKEKRASAATANKCSQLVQPTKTHEGRNRSRSCTKTANKNLRGKSEEIDIRAQRQFHRLKPALASNLTQLEQPISAHHGTINRTAGFLNIKTSTEKPRRQGQMQADCDQSRTKCKYLRVAKLRPNQARTHDTVSICRLLGDLNNRIFVVRSARTGIQFASRNESDTFLKYLEIAMIRAIPANCHSLLSIVIGCASWPGEHMRRVRNERTASRIEAHTNNQQQCAKKYQAAETRAAVS
jgi:hypothetical protein